MLISGIKLELLLSAHCKQAGLKYIPPFKPKSSKPHSTQAGLGGGSHGGGVKFIGDACGVVAHPVSTIAKGIHFIAATQ